jgi:hypothetical protein
MSLDRQLTAVSETVPLMLVNWGLSLRAGVAAKIEVPVKPVGDGGASLGFNER